MPRRTPDYGVNIGEVEIVFEVKEMRAARRWADRRNRAVTYLFDLRRAGKEVSWPQLTPHEYTRPRGACVWSPHAESQSI
jgi:hypothetical protein